MSKVSDYPFIKAWGVYMGSFTYYIQGEIDKAKAMDAPQNAIYQNQNGTWETVDGIKDTVLKQIIEGYVKEPKPRA